MRRSGQGIWKEKYEWALRVGMNEKEGQGKSGNGIEEYGV